MKSEAAAEPKSADGKSDNQVKRPAKSNSLGLVASHLAVLAIGSVGGYMYGERAEKAGDTNPDKLTISGRIEAPETYITSATDTRVSVVKVREGDRVRKGQLLISMDAAIVKDKIRESGTAIAQASKATAAAQAQVDKAQQEINVARAKKPGFFGKMFSSKKAREKEADRLRTQYMQAKMMQGQAQSGLLQAKSMHNEAGQKLSYFNITSPIDGIITVRSADPGELVKAGQVLLTISDPSSTYMRGFVPEGRIAFIKLGDKAKVILDNKGEHPIEATLSAIDKEASFTPQNVYLKEDRERQVFGVKLRIIHPDGTAKAGMPAEATFDHKLAAK